MTPDDSPYIGIFLRTRPVQDTYTNVAAAAAAAAGEEFYSYDKVTRHWSLVDREVMTSPAAMSRAQVDWVPTCVGGN
jgi:hypothetical protein